VKEKAEKLLAKYQNKCLFLEELEKDSGLSSEDLELAIIYLRKKLKKATAFELNGKFGIKFSPQIITSLERGVLQMEDTLRKLEEQLKKLDTDIDKYVQSWDSF
jgi:hypothetical protein